LKVIGRFLGIVLFVLLGIALVVSAIGMGLLGIRRNWEVTRSFGYQYSMSTTEQSSAQRTQQTLSDFIQSYLFMMIIFFPVD
jgi:hypothetical protein